MVLAQYISKKKYNKKYGISMVHVQKMVLTWYYMFENILGLLLWVLSKKHGVSMVNVQKK